MYMTVQTTKSIKMDIISNQGLDGRMRGAATWMARVLKAKESQIILAIDVCHIHARATEMERRPKDQCNHCQPKCKGS